MRTNSSFIASVNFNHKTSNLCVEMKSGKKYLYDGIPEAIGRKFRSQESWGKSFNVYIKDKFPMIRLYQVGG